MNRRGWRQSAEIAQRFADNAVRRTERCVHAPAGSPGQPIRSTASLDLRRSTAVEPIGETENANGVCFVIGKRELQIFHIYIPASSNRQCPVLSPLASQRRCGYSRSHSGRVHCHATLRHVQKQETPNNRGVSLVLARSATSGTCLEVAEQHVKLDIIVTMPRPVIAVGSCEADVQRVLVGADFWDIGIVQLERDTHHL